MQHQADAKNKAIQMVKMKLRAAGNLFGNDWGALFEKCDTRNEGALDLPDFTKALRNVCRITPKMLPKYQIKTVPSVIIDSKFNHSIEIDIVNCVFVI